MKILAHRGAWNHLDERNTKEAIFRAFDQGFGIETDIRDYAGELVISHDIANKESLSVREVFHYYKEHDVKTMLALNIKADGIQEILKKLLSEYEIQNYFLFDMSIPEMVVYEKQQFQFFTRQSEIERIPVMYEKANGVWMDEWNTNWITKAVINDHLNRGMQVGVISPEIHGRDEHALWDMLKDIDSEKFMLCTDKASEAAAFFSKNKRRID